MEKLKKRLNKRRGQKSSKTSALLSNPNGTGIKGKIGLAFKHISSKLKKSSNTVKQYNGTQKPFGEDTGPSFSQVSVWSSDSLQDVKLGVQLRIRRVESTGQKFDKDDEISVATHHQSANEGLTNDENNSLSAISESSKANAAEWLDTTSRRNHFQFEDHHTGSSEHSFGYIGAPVVDKVQFGKKLDSMFTASSMDKKHQSKFTAPTFDLIDSKFTLEKKLDSMFTASSLDKAIVSGVKSKLHDVPESIAVKADVPKNRQTDRCRTTLLPEERGQKYTETIADSSSEKSLLAKQLLDKMFEETNATGVKPKSKYIVAKTNQTGFSSSDSITSDSSNEEIHMDVAVKKVIGSVKSCNYQDKRILLKKNITVKVPTVTSENISFHVPKPKEDPVTEIIDLRKNISFHLPKPEEDPVTEIIDLRKTDFNLQNSNDEFKVEVKELEWQSSNTSDKKEIVIVLSSSESESEEVHQVCNKSKLISTFIEVQKDIDHERKTESIKKNLHNNSSFVNKLVEDCRSISRPVTQGIRKYPERKQHSVCRNTNKDDALPTCEPNDRQSRIDGNKIEAAATLKIESSSEVKQHNIEIREKKKQMASERASTGNETSQKGKSYNMINDDDLCQKKKGPSYKTIALSGKVAVEETNNLPANSIKNQLEKADTEKRNTAMITDSITSEEHKQTTTSQKGVSACETMKAKDWKSDKQINRQNDKYMRQKEEDLCHVDSKNIDNLDDKCVEVEEKKPKTRATSKNKKQRNMSSRSLEGKNQRKCIEAEDEIKERSRDRGNHHKPKNVVMDEAAKEKQKQHNISSRSQEGENERKCVEAEDEIRERSSASGKHQKQAITLAKNAKTNDVKNEKQRQPNMSSRSHEGENQRKDIENSEHFEENEIKSVPAASTKVEDKIALGDLSKIKNQKSCVINEKTTENRRNKTENSFQMDSKETKDSESHTQAQLGKILLYNDADPTNLFQFQDEEILEDHALTTVSQKILVKPTINLLQQSNINNEKSCVINGNQKQKTNDSVCSGLKVVTSKFFKEKDDKSVQPICKDKSDDILSHTRHKQKVHHRIDRDRGICIVEQIQKDNAPKRFENKPEKDIIQTDTNHQESSSDVSSDRKLISVITKVKPFISESGSESENIEKPLCTDENMKLSQSVIVIDGVMEYVTSEHQDHKSEAMKTVIKGKVDGNKQIVKKNDDIITTNEKPLQNKRTFSSCIQIANSTDSLEQLQVDTDLLPVASESKSDSCLTSFSESSFRSMSDMLLAKCIKEKNGQRPRFKQRLMMQLLKLKQRLTQSVRQRNSKQHIAYSKGTRDQQILLSKDEMKIDKIDQKQLYKQERKEHDRLLKQQKHDSNEKEKEKKKLRMEQKRQQKQQKGESKKQKSNMERQQKQLKKELQEKINNEKKTLKNVEKENKYIYKKEQKMNKMDCQAKKQQERKKAKEELKEFLNKQNASKFDNVKKEKDLKKFKNSMKQKEKDSLNQIKEQRKLALKEHKLQMKARKQRAKEKWKELTKKEDSLRHNIKKLAAKNNTLRSKIKKLQLKQNKQQKLKKHQDEGQIKEASRSKIKLKTSTDRKKNQFKPKNKAKKIAFKYARGGAKEAKIASMTSKDIKVKEKKCENNPEIYEMVGLKIDPNSDKYDLKCDTVNKPSDRDTIRPKAAQLKHKKVNFTKKQKKIHKRQHQEQEKQQSSPLRLFSRLKSLFRKKDTKGVKCEAISKSAIKKVETKTSIVNKEPKIRKEIHKQGKSKRHRYMKLDSPTYSSESDTSLSPKNLDTNINYKTIGNYHLGAPTSKFEQGKTQQRSDEEKTCLHDEKDDQHIQCDTHKRFPKCRMYRLGELINTPVECLPDKESIQKYLREHNVKPVHTLPDYEYVRRFMLGRREFPYGQLEAPTSKFEQGKTQQRSDEEKTCLHDEKDDQHIQCDTHKRFPKCRMYRLGELINTPVECLPDKESIQKYLREHNVKPVHTLPDYEYVRRFMLGRREFPYGQLEAPTSKFEQGKTQQRSDEEKTCLHDEKEDLLINTPVECLPDKDSIQKHNVKPVDTLPDYEYVRRFMLGRREFPYKQRGSSSRVKYTEASSFTSLSVARADSEGKKDIQNDSGAHRLTCNGLKKSNIHLIPADTDLFESKKCKKEDDDNKHKKKHSKNEETIHCYKSESSLSEIQSHRGIPDGSNSMRYGLETIWEENEGDLPPKVKVAEKQHKATGVKKLGDVKDAGKQIIRSERSKKGKVTKCVEKEKTHKKLKGEAEQNNAKENMSNVTNEKISKEEKPVHTVHKQLKVEMIEVENKKGKRKEGRMKIKQNNKKQNERKIEKEMIIETDNTKKEYQERQMVRTQTKEPLEEAQNRKTKTEQVNNNTVKENQEYTKEKHVKRKVANEQMKDLGLSANGESGIQSGIRKKPSNSDDLKNVKNYAQFEHEHENVNCQGAQASGINTQEHQVKSRYTSLENYDNKKSKSLDYEIATARKIIEKSNRLLNSLTLQETQKLRSSDLKEEDPGKKYTDNYNVDRFPKYYQRQEFQGLSFHIKDYTNYKYTEDSGNNCNSFDSLDQNYNVTGSPIKTNYQRQESPGLSFHIKDYTNYNYRAGSFNSLDQNYNVTSSPIKNYKIDNNSLAQNSNGFLESQKPFDRDTDIKTQTCISDIYTQKPNETPDESYLKQTSVQTYTRERPVHSYTRDNHATNHINDSAYSLKNVHAHNYKTAQSLDSSLGRNQNSKQIYDHGLTSIKYNDFPNDFKDSHVKKDNTDVVRARRYEMEYQKWKAKQNSHSVSEQIARLRNNQTQTGNSITDIKSRFGDEILPYDEKEVYPAQRYPRPLPLPPNIPYSQTKRTLDRYREILEHTRIQDVRPTTALYQNSNLHIYPYKTTTTRIQPPVIDPSITTAVSSIPSNHHYPQMDPHTWNNTSDQAFSLKYEPSYSYMYTPR